MLIKNSMIFALAAILKGAIGFLLIAVYTRMLSPAEFGGYAVIIALVTVIDMAAFMWIRHTLMRHITDEPRKDDNMYIASGVLLYAAINVPAVLMLIGAPFVSAGGLIAPFALLVLTESVSNLTILMARIRMRTVTFLMLSILKPLTALVIGGALVYAGYGVQGALWGMVGGYCISTLLGVVKAPDLKSITDPAFGKKHVKAIAAFGLPLVSVLSLQSVIRATDRVLLDILIGDEVTGLYAAAQDIPYKLLTILISAIHLAAYPLAMKALENNGQGAAREQLSRNFVFILGVLWPAMLGIAITSPALAHVILGEAFRPFAKYYMPLFAVIAAINCILQYYCVLSFHLAKQTRKLVFPFLAGLAVNALIGVIFIPLVGAKGAALGSFLSYTLLCALTLWLSRRVFPLPMPWSDSMKIMIAGAVMALLVSALNVSASLAGLILAAASGALAYGLLIALLFPEARAFLIRRGRMKYA